MYKMLISRLELTVAIHVFAISSINCLVIETGSVHQVLWRYLQEVCNGLSGNIWTYSEAELLKSSAILLQQGEIGTY